MGVRPEHVTVGEDAPFTFEAEVEIVEPMGADTLVWTQIGDQSFRFRMDGQATVTAGQVLKIGFDPATVSLFDVASEARM